MTWKTFLLEFFTWWNGQTLGTRFHTWRKGELVGEDETGNRYYRDPKTDRRWVIYSGLAEPSKIPPGWHGWIHHKVDRVPDEQDYSQRSWEARHQPNYTGTDKAYHPKGSLVTGTTRPKVSEDYEPWKP